ncbi:MAG: aminotransferase class V-fold PLP-dependent enzyme [Holosporaceae bacterium]|jgi:cysteine desulfurase|nr:aminotransferase class V-fold PLP-dependent enzyme [Holosporaceae bacterium]
MKTIYMDYQATTPCDRRVLDEMIPYFCDIFGNPHSSTHIAGTIAHKAIEKARKQISDLIMIEDPNDIVFTSGSTESNNIAIQGVARSYKLEGAKIITSPIEHKCVLESCEAMKREGFDIVKVPVLENGIIDLNALENLVDDKTVLVSIIFVNNEIGTIQPIEEISKICRKRGVLFHTDASQVIGKIPVDASLTDLMSISGHKTYGPKGIGALYVRAKPRVKLMPLFWGGGQERGIRSGTLPTPLCVGLGKACEIAQQEMHEERHRLMELGNYFIKKIMDNLPKVYLNGDMEKRIPGCINLSFEGIEGEALMLNMPDVCLSSGSACTSDSLSPSYVLEAISDREEIAHSSLRIGLGRFTTLEEVEYVSSKIIESVIKLRAISPLWEEQWNIQKK